MRQICAATAMALALMAGAAAADPVTDALTAAQEAYAAGQLAETAAALTNATRAVQAIQQARLAAALPPAPDGWTLTLSQDDAAAMAMFGGMVGTTVNATYSHDDGRYVTVTLTADSPLVASMAGMLGSPQMMAMMGPVVKVGAIDMLDQGGSLSALVANRVLVQAQGGAVADMAALLAPIDFDRLGQFDQ